MDFKNAKKYILERLENELSPDLYYHGVHHTVDVYEVSIKIAEVENLSQEEKVIINTAALYHDSGFLFEYQENERLAVKLIKEVLPKFGYNRKQMDAIGSVILSTQLKARPNTLLQKIMSDADYDYLGREDNFKIAESLSKELKANGFSFNDEEWNNMQIRFLNKHEYHTSSSIQLRREKKWDYLRHLKTLKF
ncbi:MAG: HD domain-containing protein [Vicingaceae bacterium]|nr:HD domain-containing protein [Vicingaceae bacterium]